MKKIISMLFIASVLAMTFSSCKKKDDDDDNQVKASLIKEVKATYSANEWEKWKFTYDAQKRVTKVENFWLNDFDKEFIYDYSTPGKLSITRTGQAPVMHDLDSQGRIIKEYLAGSDFNTYEYNADGYLVKVKWTRGGTEYTRWEIEITNGNIAKHTRKTSGGVVDRIKVFFFTPGDNVNNLDQGIVIDSNWKTVGGLYGKTSKKLVDRLNYWNGPGDEPNTKTTTISYEFDLKNRPSKVTRTGVGWQEVFEYTYYD